MMMMMMILVVVVVVYVVMIDPFTRACRKSFRMLAPVVVVLVFVVVVAAAAAAVVVRLAVTTSARSNQNEKENIPLWRQIYIFPIWTLMELSIKTGITITRLDWCRTADNS